MSKISSLSISAMSARHAALKAGVPQDKPVLTLNKLSASAFHAMIVSAQEILTGSANISLAGGMENLSSVPFVVRGARFGVPLTSSIMFEDWLSSSNYDTYCSLPLFRVADILADMYGTRREDVDEFALRSQKKWKAAHVKGLFNSEVVPVKVDVNGQEQLMTTDEFPRSDTTMETLSTLAPLFKGGVCTVGNVCGTNDGAAAIVLSSEEALTKHNLTPLSRLMAWACVGVEPALMCTGPVVAVRSLLAAARLTMEDIDLFEIHETFAAQALICARELNVDPEKLNVNGGAIAIGHPSGASGARLALHITLELK
ncbi:Thiolase 2 [Operophtera brumata]|uniref:Thiolase 2 n=1 Tax=Operophtera brumata TaxID=104452 RepID=A0A0L7L901_OPEBR|nr:Thiolase 2 [Operophtera brumata]